VNEPLNLTAVCPLVRKPSAVKLSAVCPEYTRLREAEHDAIQALQSHFLRTGDDPTEGFRRAMVFREIAMQRAREHKRTCLLCTNVKAARTEPIRRTEG
jgi:hypothetical protein